MGAPRNIAIVGAGISGLTLALTLAKFGLRVTVLEQKAEVAEFGAGLQISSNARKCLDALGLRDAVAAASFEPRGIDLYPFASDKPLQTLSLGKAIADRFGAPYAVMHRGDLAAVLYAAAKRFANIEIVFGVEQFEITEKLGKAAISFNETGDRRRTIKPFALVGADGLRSAVRKQWLEGRDPAYSGKVAWRALVAPERLGGTLNLDRVSVLFGTRHHLVVYPLPHRNVVNLALFSQEREKDLDALNNGQPSVKAGKDERLNSVLKAVGGAWTPWVLSEVTMERWHKGAVGLIGDAAHAMLPFQAQGAAMGIEDAATLAPLLATSPNPEHAFIRYAALRQPRVKRIQHVSRNNGKIFHMPFPMSLARDAVIRAEGPEGHFKRLDWLYGYEVVASA